MVERAREDGRILKDAAEQVRRLAEEARNPLIRPARFTLTATLAVRRIRQRQEALNRVFP